MIEMLHVTSLIEGEQARAGSLAVNNELDESYGSGIIDELSKR